MTIDPGGVRRSLRRKRAHVVVAGRVQGVWFRASVRDEAIRRGTDGWVRNLPDGTVEAMIEGETDAVDRLVDFCRSGPAGARVDRIEVSEHPPSDDLQGFEIRS